MVNTSAILVSLEVEVGGRIVDQGRGRHKISRSALYASMRGARDAARKGGIGGVGDAAGEGVAESEFSSSVSSSSSILLVFQSGVRVCKASGILPSSSELLGERVCESWSSSSSSGACLAAE